MKSPPLMPTCDDAPDERSILPVEGFLPGKHAVVDAVDECAVQIETGRRVRCACSFSR